MFYNTINHLSKRLRKNTFTILYAHSVLEQPVNYGTTDNIPPLAFQRQVNFLKQHYHIITLQEAIERNAAGDDLKNCLALTFDDGLKDAYHIIAPILNKAKVSATFFVMNDMINNQQLMWRNQLWYIQRTKKTKAHQLLGLSKRSNLLTISKNWDMAKKDQLTTGLWQNCGLPNIQTWLANHQPYLTTFQIQEMHQAGFEFGAHTLTHPFCNKMTISQLEKEINITTQSLSQKLDMPITIFAYPFGVRPNATLEEQLIQKTTLKTLLSIDFKGLNGGNPLKWGRRKMGKTLGETLFNLSVVLPF